MTPEQSITFARTVDAMRAAQKKYFETRTSTNLMEAKKLEARVDQLLLNYKQILQPTPIEQNKLL